MPLWEISGKVREFGENLSKIVVRILSTDGRTPEQKYCLSVQSNACCMFCLVLFLYIIILVRLVAIGGQLRWAYAFSGSLLCELLYIFYIYYEIVLRRNKET